MNPATSTTGLRRPVQNTVFPLQRVNPFTYPIQDDYERAKDKARQLLKQVVLVKDWLELEEKGVLQLTGKRGIYVISPYSETEIRGLESGRCVAYACLQLTIPAPTYDRMVAEYLLIKNAEDVYWNTANIFSRSGNELGIATLFLIALDIVLFGNMLLEVLPAH